MTSDNLYRVRKEDLVRLEQLLNDCFSKDPLYETLIPDEKIRKRLMPKLFRCDMDEFFENCEIFSSSRELTDILVVSDKAEPRHILNYYITEAKAVLSTDAHLIKEDPSLKTLWNFLSGGDYLNSAWTSELHQKKRLHIIYLAVAANLQHHGIAGHLLTDAITYANKNNLMMSLETHNVKNLDFYYHYGFKLYKILEKNFSLKQYCLIRPASLPLPE